MAKNGRFRHKDVLVESPPDVVALADAVESRFIELCGMFYRMHGVELVPPKDFDSDMFLWRKMRLRHKRGDFRHTRDEQLATRRIAEWTLRENAKLKNQPYEPVQWKD